MTGQVVLGLSGSIGAGKTTFAGRLEAAWGFRRIAFADPLKEEVLARLRRTLGAIWRLHYGGEPTVADLRRLVCDLKPPGVRELLQEYGTDVRRADDPEYWARQWAARIASHERVVADDVRFPNEIDAVRKAGGQVVRIRRQAFGVQHGHASEHALDGWQDWDFDILNDGGITDLWAEADRVARAAGCVEMSGSG